MLEQLPGPALIGMEATCNSQWSVELVEDLGHAIWIGDAAEIQASYAIYNSPIYRQAMLVTVGQCVLWTGIRIVGAAVV